MATPKGKRDAAANGKREREYPTYDPYDPSLETPEQKEERLRLEFERKKEIRETNRLAARECRARKKRLMSDLEKTVGKLTSEHTALMKQNRELTIRLETLQRTVGLGIVQPPAALTAQPGSISIPGISSLPGQHSLSLGDARRAQLLAGLNHNIQSDLSKLASIAVANPSAQTQGLDLSNLGGQPIVKHLLSPSTPAAAPSASVSPSKVP